MLKVKFTDYISLLGKVLKQLAFSLLTIASVLGLAFVMNYSGAIVTMGMAFAATLPKVREKIQGVGANMAVSPSKDFSAELKAEADKWGKLINALGMRTE